MSPIIMAIKNLATERRMIDHVEKIKNTEQNESTFELLICPPENIFIYFDIKYNSKQSELCDAPVVEDDIDSEEAVEPKITLDNV